MGRDHGQFHFGTDKKRIERFHPGYCSGVRRPDNPGVNREKGWTNSMSDYRIYGLNGGGEISFAEWIEAADDTDAIQQARSHNHAALKREVWQANRLVGSLGTTDDTDVVERPRWPKRAGLHREISQGQQLLASLDAEIRRRLTANEPDPELTCPKRSASYSTTSPDGNHDRAV